MKDQADKLRQIIDNIKHGEAGAAVAEPTARVITVTSGKGGVGKTNITANLALTFCEMGYRVIIIDADLGLSNIDVMLGIIPKYTLADVINNNAPIMDVITGGPNNVKFISGGSGIEEMTRLDDIQMEKILNNLSELDKNFDIILIDTGAGISDNVLKFAIAADEVLIIVTPEPTSVTDAYAMIKALANRSGNISFKLIINKAETENEARDVFNRLSMVTAKFLGVSLTLAGFLLYDPSVVKAVKMQRPFTISFPGAASSKSIKDVAFALTGSVADSRAQTGISGFLNKLIKIFQK